MKRYLISLALILMVVTVPGIFFFQDYWIHRYDELIARQASVYRLDERLVWSVIHEETYFSAWKVGNADEVGLMQVTPLVAWPMGTRDRAESIRAPDLGECGRIPSRS